MGQEQATALTAQQDGAQQSRAAAGSAAAGRACAAPQLQSLPTPEVQAQPPAGTEALVARICFCTIVYTNSTKVKLHQEGLRKQHLTTMALMNAEFYNQEITML